jgi:hypothetical protein
MSNDETMSNERDISNDKWRTFYAAEKEMLSWIQENGITLYRASINTVEYIEYTDILGHTLQRPQKYIRHVTQLDNFEQGKYLFNNVKQLYIEAKQANQAEAALPVKFPNRFPHFIDNAVQVNVAENEAYKSFTYTRSSSPFLIASFHLDEYAEQNATDLKRTLELHGICDVRIELNHKILSLYVYIGTDALLDYFKADKVQVRELTGTQYIARVRCSTGENLRLPLGFILVNSRIPVYRTLPQKTRSHKLKPEDELKFPIDVKYSFYLKEPKQQ